MRSVVREDDCGWRKGERNLAEPASSRTGRCWSIYAALLPISSKGRIVSLALLVFRAGGLAQLERDVHWLHGLLHHRYQLLTQGVQVQLIAQCCTNCCQCSGRIIFAAVEAAVDDGLNAPQWVKQDHNCQRGDDNRNIARLTDEPTQEGLK